MQTLVKSSLYYWKRPSLNGQGRNNLNHSVYLRHSLQCIHRIRPADNNALPLDHWRIYSSKPLISLIGIKKVGNDFSAWKTKW